MVQLKCLQWGPGFDPGLENLEEGQRPSSILLKFWIRKAVEATDHSEYKV